MTLQALDDQLRELRLSTFRNALREQQANPKYNDLTFEDRLSLLVDAECTQRRENRIKRNIRTAKFPMQATLEELDFSPSRGLDRRSILELGQPGWIASRHNILVLGPTGSGKTYLASALGVAAARNGYTVRYHRISRLLHILAIARQDGSLSNLLRSLAKTNLLILDDWMRDAITIQNAQDILDVLDDRFGHAATLISSQVPVTDWHLRIPDPTLADAILDRIVHTAHRIQLEGESQRKLRANRSMPHT
ncbi:MAG TPA: IS21-like element helper ATPase IstB [Anaerolineales bacterium]|jgi:DNA replication protein DnaC|nr:IS21-like element helper ATPase IstB [Anaerolineales bacterium]